MAEPADRFFEFAGAAAALCRLGQRGRAAAGPGSWRARPLPQLGCDRARIAAVFPCHGAGSARARQFRLGEGKQLQSGRSCLRSHATDALCEVAGSRPCRPFDGRDGRAGLCRDVSGAGVAPGVLDGVFLSSAEPHADPRADVAMDRPTRSHRGARGEHVPDRSRRRRKRLSTRNKRLTRRRRCISPRHGVRQRR